MTRRTDQKARVTLPPDFACCLVSVEREGNELRIRNVGKISTRRYTFKQLMAGVTKENIHGQVNTGPAL
jgi:hypothetical protein